MDVVVFFADVLGFSAMATEDTARAERALDDVALLFSSHDEIAAYLQRDSPWTSRYGLSDSILLIAKDSVAAASAAAQFFFQLAYLNTAVPDQRVLMRGAVVRGDVVERGPIFTESGKANVVGEAVVRATLLEKSGVKGPRLLVDENVAGVLRGSKHAWLLDDAEGVREWLWPLPPDPSDIEISHLRPVCSSSAEAFLTAPARVADHYVAYVDLILRSLQRLRSHDAGAAKTLVGAMQPDDVLRRLIALDARRAAERLEVLL